MRFWNISPQSNITLTTCDWSEHTHGWYSSQQEKSFAQSRPDVQSASLSKATATSANGLRSHRKKHNDVHNREECEERCARAIQTLRLRDEEILALQNQLMQARKLSVRVGLVLNYARAISCDGSVHASVFHVIWAMVSGVGSNKLCEPKVTRSSVAQQPWIHRAHEYDRHHTSGLPRTRARKSFSSFNILSLAWRMTSMFWRNNWTRSARSTHRRS